MSQEKIKKEFFPCECTEYLYSGRCNYMKDLTPASKCCPICAERLNIAGDGEERIMKDVCLNKKCSCHTPSLSQPEKEPEYHKQDWTKPCDCCGGGIATHWQGHVCSKDNKSEPTPPHQEWDEQYDLEKEKFIIYDKASGSRWRDDNYIKAFISKLLEEAEIREHALMYAKQVVESDKAYERGKKEGYERWRNEQPYRADWNDKEVQNMLDQAKAEELTRIKSLIEGMKHELGQSEVFADSPREYYKEGHSDALIEVLTLLQDESLH